MFATAITKKLFSISLRINLCKRIHSIYIPVKGKEPLACNFDPFTEKPIMKTSTDDLGVLLIY